MSFQHNDIEKYIDILQNSIVRMANNSSQCKTWCLTISSALIVMFIKGECSKQFMWLMLLPPILFWFIDAYYLHLENAFRDIYNSFINECKSSEEHQAPDTTYQINVKSSFLKTIAKMFTMSTFPFYGFLLLVLGLALFFREVE